MHTERGRETTPVFIHASVNACPITGSTQRVRELLIPATPTVLWLRAEPVRQISPRAGSTMQARLWREPLRRTLGSRQYDVMPLFIRHLIETSVRSEENTQELRIATAQAFDAITTRHLLKSETRVQ